jgi:hypothetical protein
MIIRWWLWLCVIGAVPLAVWGYDRMGMIAWVGGTDLEIVFVFTDADTGEPIQGVKLQVHSEGGFYKESESEEKEFNLVTDETGTVRRVCHNSMCYGERSSLGFTDTFGVHLPWWFVSPSAPEYEPGEQFFLADGSYQRRVQRIAPGRTRLMVPVALRRVDPGIEPR